MTGQENKKTQDDAEETVEVEQDSQMTEDLLNTVSEALEIEVDPEPVQDVISDIESLQNQL